MCSGLIAGPLNPLLDPEQETLRLPLDPLCFVGEAMVHRALYALIACNDKKVLKPVGEWNSSRIIINGAHGEHWLNGEKVVDLWGGVRNKTTGEPWNEEPWHWYSEHVGGGRCPCSSTIAYPGAGRSRGSTLIDNRSPGLPMMPSVRLNPRAKSSKSSGVAIITTWEWRL